MRSIPPIVDLNSAVRLLIVSSDSSSPPTPGQEHVLKLTSIQIVELQEISLLVDLIRMLVEKAEDGL